MARGSSLGPTGRSNPMKALAYTTLIMLAATAFLAAAPVSAAPICAVNNEVCVSTIPQSQCLLELSGLVALGVGCNGGTLTVICAVGNIGCFSINTPGCHLMVGITQQTMICVV